MGWIRLAPTLLAKVLIKVAYFFSCLFFKVNRHKVTFASYRSEELSGNLYYVWKELSEQYPDYTCQFAFKKFKGSKLGKLNYLFHMIKVSYDLATSALFIIDDFYFPVYVIKPRRNTSIVQLWHASGALKKFGYSTIGKSFGPSPKYLKHVKLHSNYSKVFVSSTEVIPFYAEAFNMPADRIYPLGIPRTDILLSSDQNHKAKQKFHELYPNLKNKKLILYAPTYRGKSHYQDQFQIPMDLDKMEQHLGKDYALLVHLHPYMKPDTEFTKQNKGFAIQITKEFDIQELLMVADLLITDYSTVMFDYSLLERPMAFFADDLGAYIEERDFYYSYDQLIPGPFFTKTQELIDWIEKESFDIKSVTDFRNRFFEENGGKASEKIVGHLVRT